jgi:hypothetical protein
VAGLAALWGAYVLRPLLSLPPRFDQITAVGLILAKLGGIPGIVFVAGVIPGRVF